MTDSAPIEKIACTKPCGSSDAMQTYLNGDGSRTGYCHVCGHYDGNPYGDSSLHKHTYPEESTTSYSKDKGESLSTIHAYGQADGSDRGILPMTIQYFGIKQDPHRRFSYYPYFKGQEFKGYKKRVKESKEFYTVGNQKDVDLFGQAQAISAQNHKLIITEGEEDAMAAFQMLWVYQQKSIEYKDQLPSVVSLPHGAGSALKDLAGKDEFFKRFKTIVLAFDQDEAGQKATQDALDVLPMDKVLVAKLSEKDSNDMLLKGKDKEFCQEILFKASPWVPSTVLSVEDAFEDAISMPTMGLSWPWVSLTEATEGLKDCDLTGVAAGVGIGKTTFWHKVISHIIQVHNEPAGLCFLEEDPGDTLKNLATHNVNKRFISAKGNFTQDELRNAVSEIRGRVFMFKHDHKTLQSVDPWDSVKSTIKYMVLVKGCKHIVVDPLTALVAHLSSSEANDKLNSVMAEVEGMAKVLNFKFYYGAHLNAPKDGKSHEEGGRVKLSQLTGSKAMIKWSHNIIGLERNTQADTAEERNTTTVRMLKARKLGKLIDFPVYYDENTGSFNEVARREPATYSVGSTIDQPAGGY